jgi:hypothetical protein
LKEAAGSGGRPKPGSEAWEAARERMVSALAKLKDEIEAGDFPPGNPYSSRQL